jgi:hypothetical protein
MAELSLTFPAPANGTSVTGEQTQARLEEFHQMPWLEPDWEDSTRTALQVVERYWRTYGSLHRRLQLLRASSLLIIAHIALRLMSITRKPCSVRNPPCT